MVKQSERFIRVLVDCTDKNVWKKVKAERKLLGLPTVLFLDAQGGRRDEVVGSSPAATFLKKFEAVLREGGGAVAPSAAPKDERLARILERVERELAESGKRVRADVLRIVREGLEKGGVARAAQPAPKPPEPDPDVDRQIEALIPQLAEDGVTGRFRKFLTTKKGKDFVRRSLDEQGFDSLDDAVEMYFEKVEGKYTIKQEYADQLEQLLDERP